MFVCIISVSDKQRKILSFREFVDFTKYENGIFGKLTSGLENGI